ncbi:MAG: hypothetical protein GY898_18515 [Proteobacteria bacterium]|nr:hypothetical protein [Pseudomonadota bacterium]
MSSPPTADLERLLDHLVASGVEFILIGGAAAVWHGAPVTTRDIDIVHRRSDDNAARLLGALEELDVHIIEPAKRRLKPSLEMLLGNGQLNLATSLGPVDVLCQLHDGRGYEDLVEHTVLATGDAGELLILDAVTLVEIKSAIGRYRDKLAVAYLLTLIENKS